MKIILLTRSSFSHDLSNFLYLRNHGPYFDNPVFIILSFSPSAIFNDKSIYLPEYQSVLKRLRILCFDFTSPLLRILGLLVFILPLSFLSLFRLLNVILLQPSPSWFYLRFGCLASFLPSFNSHLVGDGVGYETLSSTPFWLSHIYPASRRCNVLSSSYAFSFCQTESQSTFFRLKYNSSLLKSVFLDSFDSLIDILFADFPLLFEPLVAKDSLVIYLSTTLSEYSRMPLENEVNLYRESLSLIYNNPDLIHFTSLLFKPHPITSPQKLEALVSLVSQYYPEESTNKLTEAMTILALTPLENLIAHLLKLRPDFEITIYATSAAFFPSIIAFPTVKYRLLFGDLLKSHFFSDVSHYFNRIKQESLIRLHADLLL